MKKALTKFITGAFYPIIGSAFFLIFAMNLLSCKPKLEPAKPKNLAETIAANMKEHISDWTFTTKEGNITVEKHPNIIGSTSFETWENKKCDLKLRVAHMYLFGTSLTLTSPDTISFNEDDTHIIAQAHFTMVELPKIERQNRIEDSLREIENKKTKIKEDKILSKICK